MNVALLGATGAIGESIAAELRKRNESYRVVGRDRASLDRAFGSDPLTEIVTWNPDDASSVRAALRGADTAVYLIGVPYNHFELHPVLMRQMLDAASAEGVSQMLLVGTVYPYGRPQQTPAREDHPREPHTFKGKMRKQQEDLLLEADAAGKIRGTVLRLPDFYGPRVKNSFLDSVFNVAAKGGTANLIAPIDRPHQFVYVPDVGPVVLDLLQRPEAHGRWWHLAGDGTASMQEIVAMVGELAGKPIKTRVVGLGMLRLIGIFQPVMRELVEMNYLLTDPFIMDDSALRTLLGNVKTTPLRDGLRQSLEAARRK
ncbi:MAG TPA: NAD-dependent epimerase/dehydratase family protein [Acidobacteriaceae bacterium]|nr:NAD-dependent epimerase/dehydratase family protein [Acidobacteriaceae bacterium]